MGLRRGPALRATEIGRPTVGAGGLTDHRSFPITVHGSDCRDTGRNRDFQGRRCLELPITSAAGAANRDAYSGAVVGFGRGVRDAATEGCSRLKSVIPDRARR
jgi:hypothetical protein